MTGIEWTDETWNPIRARREGVAELGVGWACVRVSPGCVHCYAETLNRSRRWNRGTGLPYDVPALEHVEPYLDEEALNKPLSWQKPRRVFVCSMTDLFGEWVPDEWIDRVFGVMAQSCATHALDPEGRPAWWSDDGHFFQVLTKRPERMRAYMADPDRPEKIAAVSGLLPIWPPPNVWLGVSVEDQQRADERIPVLLDTLAAVRFVSAEPLLEAIRLHPYWTHGRPAWGKLETPAGRYAIATRPLELCRGLDWIIVGGESGPGARPFDPAWALSILDECRPAGVAFFMKQFGSHPEDGAARVSLDVRAPRIKLKHRHGGDPGEWPDELSVREMPTLWKGTGRS